MPRTAMNSRRSRTSCSILALATVMAVGATPASAQSFLGTGTYATNPNATGIVTAPNTTTINLNGGQTVINWIPTDNAVGTGTNINFQNNGTTATFTSTQNFAVLNNINQADMSRAIVMNGTVNSFVNGSQGGSVYFYSPGGFIFGGGSLFNVGSLVVSALPIQWDANGFIGSWGTDNTVVFGQALNPTASISSGGAINANIPAFGVGGAAGDSYVAMVAPHVAHGGSISVNGSAALVAAEAATISFSTDGLFDIQVTTGTTSTSGLDVNGSIGGPTPDGSTDKQGIYLVAVPKNDALTMVIGVGADLGFTLANDASIDDNGVIVLSAGHDIDNGAIGARSAGHGAEAADFWFTGAHATNNLIGEATGTAYLYSTGPGAFVTTFDNDVTVHAGNSVQVQSFVAGASLTVGGDLNLSTDFFAMTDGGSATGGLTNMFADNGGTISIAGNLSMTADGYGASGDTVVGGNGTGGTVYLSASNGGSISIGNVESGGNVHLSASGNGGTGFGGGSGNGTGGVISVNAVTDGDISIFGETEVYAEGRGGTNWDSETTAGFGQGGNIFVGASGTGSTLSLTGALISANGIGGGAGEGTCCAAVGGAGTGGLVGLSATNGSLIESTGTLELSAAGEGGLASGIGGSGTGGANANGVFVDAQSGATLDVVGSLWLDATGSGGDGDSDGGAGTGGGAGLYVTSAIVNVSDQINVDADGFGGESYLGGNGGVGTGGLAEIITSGSTAEINALNVLIEADATGGDSSNFSEGPLGDGGDAFGGRTRLSVNDGNVHITGDLTMTATSTGGFGASGGDATGVVTPTNNEGLPPAAFVWAEASTAELRVDGLTEFDVSATGGDGSDGNGGNASAGEVDLVSRHGDVILGDVIGNADAFGGAGGFGGGTGGNATGGAIDVSWALDQTTGLSGLISLETVALSANGTGGDGGEGLFVQGGPGGTGGAGGNGNGGGISYVGSAGGGTLDVGSTTLQANGYGGAGGNGGSGDTGGNGGAGGNATGGFIQTGTISNDLSTTSGGTATFTFLSATVNASGGVGGDGGEGINGTGVGGDGGDAIGGTNSFLARGVVVTADSVNLFANASGGNGGFGSVSGNGGDASTGFVSVESKDRFGHDTQRGSLTANSILGTAIAQGGEGATNGTSTLRGGSYFRVLNGDADIGSVTFTFTGDLYDGTTVYNGTTGPNYIQAQDGTAIVGTFDYSTTGELAIYTTDTGSMDVGDLTLSAGNFVDHPTIFGPDVPGTIFATNLSVTSGGDFIADAHLDVDNGIDISVPGSIHFNNASSDSSIDLWAQGGSIVIGDTDAGGSVSLLADSFIVGGDVAAGGSIFAQTFGGNINLGSLTSAFGSISLNADGDVWLAGDAMADGDIDVTANGNIIMQNAVAGESIELDAGGYLDSGGGYVDGLDLTAGDSIEVLAAEWVDLGNLSAGLVDPSFNEGADYTVAILAGGDILTGNIEAAQDIGLATPGTMTTGAIDAGGIFMALGTGDMSFGDATAGSEIYLADFSMMELGGAITDEFDPNPILASAPTPTGGSIVIGAVSTGRFTAAAGTNLTTGSIESDSAIALQGGGDISTGDLVAGDFVLANGGSITTGDIDATSVEMTSAAGNISSGDIFAFGDVELDAFGDISTGDIVAGTIDLFAGDDISTGDLTTQQLVLAELDGGFTTLLYPGASVTLESGGDISTGNIDSIDGVYANAGGSISTGWIEANDFVELYSGTFTDTGYIDAGSYIYADAGGYIDAGDLSAGAYIELVSGSDIDFGNADAGVLFEFEAGGSVTGGDVFAGLTIEGEAAGSVELGNLTAGFEPNEAIDDDTFSVGIQAIGSINVGDVQGANRVGFATLGDLTTGSIQAGWDFFAFSDGDIVTGAITTGESDQVFMSGSEAFFAAGGGEDSDFIPDQALAGDPSPTGGSITINGPVNTGVFRASAGTNFIANAINAPGSYSTEEMFVEGIQVRAGGTAAVNGEWTAGNVHIVSNDINITGTGLIDAGSVQLVSSNATQTVVGDGVGGGGYQLSDAEYDRIHASGEIEVHADTSEGAAANMILGDLSVAVPEGGGEGEGIEYEFATSDGDSEDSGIGRIRVVGDVIFTGTGAESVSFTTGTFELDAATGLLALTSNGTDLAGFLEIEANHVHVASGEILDLLAENPTYTGYQQDLNEPATVQRPDGVIKAASIQLDLEGSEPVTVFVQNTGTSETPAGFLVTEDIFLGEGGDYEGPAGSINVVINGQIQTEGGTLTGIAVRDAMVEAQEGDLTPFTANSTINGCPLTGACIIAPPPPPPTADLVDNQIDLLNGNPFGDSEFDDTQEGDEGATNPISPPQPLFDTRPLIPSGDVDDPVSGTGNPALLSASECVEDEDTQCGTEKESGQ